MREKLSCILTLVFSITCVAYSRVNTSYYVTTFASDIQESRSTTPSTFDDHLKYKNISIYTKLIELPKAAGLSQIISTLSNLSPKSFPSANEKELIQLSQFSNKWKGIFEEAYWNIKLASSDITSCSQVFLLQSRIVAMKLLLPSDQFRLFHSYIWKLHLIVCLFYRYLKRILMHTVHVESTKHCMRMC